MMPGHYDYETDTPAQTLAQDSAQYGGSDSAHFNGSTEPVDGCAGRLDATGWDGVEDTDPVLEIDVAPLVVGRGL
jgi:hypothetical protein